MTNLELSQQIRTALDAANAALALLQAAQEAAQAMAESAEEDSEEFETLDCLQDALNSCLDIETALDTITDEFESFEYDATFRA